MLRRGAVRGAWIRTPVWAFLAVPLGCAGGYPIDPTPCDYWCDARKEKECLFYDPAECVAECERSNLTARADCADAFEKALACFQGAEMPCDESDPFFYFAGPWPCSAEEQAFMMCVYGGRGF